MAILHLKFDLSNVPDEHVTEAAHDLVRSLLSRDAPIASAILHPGGDDVLANIEHARAMERDRQPEQVTAAQHVAGKLGPA